MTFSRIPKSFQLILCWCSLLAFISMWPSSVTGHAANRLFRGEVGGNVAIQCPFKEGKKIRLFYLQRNKQFVNGYYEGKDTNGYTWENTKANRTTATVYMSNLNMTHQGTYTCIIMYADTHEPENKVDLVVTAKYSKPNITVEKNGSVTCAAHGGYPKDEIVWNIQDQDRLDQIGNNHVQDPRTSLFNISSSVTLNCSSGSMNLSCSIGNFTSDKITFCVREDPPHSSNLLLIVGASILALIITVVSLVGIYCRRKKRQRVASLSNLRRTSEQVRLHDVNREGGEP